MNYTHKKVGSVIEIFRGDTKVAEYNPVDEEIKFVKKDFVKYEPEVQKVIDGLTDDSDEVQPPADEVQPPETEVAISDADKIAALELEKEALEKRVAQLTRVNQDLEIQIKQMMTSSESITTTHQTPERFSDDVPMEGAPEQDRMLGDLTPAYIKWAKKNWSPEIFEKRYYGRIKDLKNV
jgi:hypothetical protein